MKLFQGLFLKCFKSSTHIHLNVLNHRLFLRSFLNSSNRLLSNQTLINQNEFFKAAELTPACVLKSLSLPENDEKLSKIISEVNHTCAKKRPCPEFLSSVEIYKLYALETKSQRLKYLNYLFKQEKVKEKDRLKKEEKKKERHNRNLNKESSFSCDLSKYGLGSKSLLLNIRKKSINKFYNQRLAISALFGNKIVIDLDYDKYMVEKERKSCVDQLIFLMTANKKNLHPFDLYFCNANPTSECVQHLKRDVPRIEDSLITLSEGSYLNIFPKEHLVYLSPHANESLQFFDPNAIYIIGAFVDVVRKDRISSEKASIEGIKSYSLPLDDHIKWKAGSRSLTINQVFEIMLTVKNTGDWKKAFECVPIRKVHNPKSVENDEQSNCEALMTN